MGLSGTRRFGAATIALACVLGVLAVLAPSASAARLVRNDRYTGVEDTVLRVKASHGVLANDRVRRAVRRVVVVKAPRHGTVKLGRRGAIRYRPTADWSGRDRFLYRAVDRRGRRSVAVVRIEIKPADDPTITVDESAGVLEDGVVSGNVLVNDSDVDSPLRILEHNAARAPGSFTIRPGGDWTYAPAADWSGTALVGYATTTGALGTLTVTVTPVDDPTVTKDDSASVVAGGGQITGNVLTNDSDVDSALRVTSFAFDAGDDDDPVPFGWDPDGTWYFTPGSSWRGSAIGTYTTNTGATGTLTITVG
ncbi:Ig-like domain-containing protein [Nocardioides sp. YIM 152315]|uniref:Ig-like domain-containing protein n=1 Tax=Nocardioides sp. YIM 152315 TaxID=3031760 RepID=UPI0023DB5433|nr:Ig-like domain-containing protein [Nocardioides sp. YIM 152315]MDF1604561.1 Ig-like domain-containing protein [Nocardioides sp. YIM 152315]